MHYGQGSASNTYPSWPTCSLAGLIDFRVIRIVEFPHRPAHRCRRRSRPSTRCWPTRHASWNSLSDRPRWRSWWTGWCSTWIPTHVRVAKQRDDDRHVDVTADHSGMAEIWGRVRATDAAALNQKLDELAATVCPDDPRTKRQRRADALMALLGRRRRDGVPVRIRSSAPAENLPTSSAVVIHVLAEAATVEGHGDEAGVRARIRSAAACHGASTSPRAPSFGPSYTPKIRRLSSQYRPSAARADFVRSRDLTCRCMGCDKPAWQADIDHTVPYPLGPTHPSNNDMLLPVSSPAQDFSLRAGRMDQ